MSRDPNQQKNAFYSGEGDAWFWRNQKNRNVSEHDPDIKLILEVVENGDFSIDRILEVGCSDGRKLELLSRGLSADGFGIDPSVDAIRAATLRSAANQRLHFSVGDASNLQFESEYFDLVIFGFVLYLVDRSLLMSALAQADRVLRPGGLICLTDFDSGYTHQRTYIHHPEVRTYKSQYADVFTSTGCFHLIAKMSYSHLGPGFHPSREERIATSILYKETDWIEFCGDHS